MVAHMFKVHEGAPALTVWSNDLVVKVLDSQSKGSVFKTTGWLQGRPSLSPFRGR